MNSKSPEKILEKIYAIILERKKSSPESSYVSSLLYKGKDSILKKIGEESAEVIIASKNDKKDEQIHEIADLWFHTLVLIVNQGITLENIMEELKNRLGKSGLREKESRRDINF